MVGSTLRALASRRRLIPVALVAAGLTFVEATQGDEPLGPLVIAVMIVSFVTIGPASWRLAQRASEAASGARQGLNLAGYALVGLVVVAATGLLLPQALSMGPTILTDAAGLPLTLVLFWVGGWGLGRDIELELSLERERARRNEAQLMAMRAHLDPHFLFNTLNAIAEWCREDPAEAEAATLRLAAMLRIMLDGLTVDRWSLERELDLVDDLWALHRARDPERFSTEVSLDEDALAQASLPPMLLIPIAENAMTHGVWRGGRGAVSLRALREDGRIRIVIDSPGAYGGPRTEGHGLATVRERLALAFGTEGRVEIGPDPDDEERTRVVLSFPREMGAAA